MLKTILKSSLLATCCILGLSTVAHGQTKEFSLETISASQGLNLIHPELEDRVSQVTTPRRTRKRRSRARQGKKTYFGTGVGIFLPGDVSAEGGGLPDDASFNYSNAFSIDFFGGYKFSRYFSGEFDMSIALGGLEVENVPNEDAINDLDLDYTAFGIYLNPRFELPLAEDKLKLYVAPGVGFSVVSSDNDRDFDGDGETDSLTNDSGFSYQIKGGAAYQVSDRVSIFGQARYNNFTLQDVDDLSIDNLTGVALELGATF